MGCGASHGSLQYADVAAATPAAEGRAEAADELRACWVSVAGGAVGAALSAQQVRGLLAELGRNLGDEDFDAAFKAMDSDSSGAIEFPEFVEFYKASSAAEKKKIRGLRAQEELLRRLEGGELTLDEERIVRQRLSLPPRSSSLELQDSSHKGEGTIGAKVEHGGQADMSRVDESRSEQQKQQQEEEIKLSEQKRQREPANELDSKPTKPIGRIVVLELKGGNDKQTKGAGKGHRRDTFPICDAVKTRGWECEVAMYSASDHTTVATLCESADGVIVRAAQGEADVFGEAGPSRLHDLLQTLVDMGVAVMPHPTAFRQLGARRMLSVMGERQFPLGIYDTQVYESIDEVRAVVTDISWLAAGPRVLKANHSVQGEHVWLCKRSEQADNKDEIIVQHALDGSIVTTSAEKFVTEQLSMPFQGQANKTGRSVWAAEGPEICYLVDQPYLQEVQEKGELLVTMVGPTPVLLQRRVPAPGNFSATFKSGAKFEKCNVTDSAWAAMRATLVDVTTTNRPTTLMEMAGCPAGTSLPLLWTMELLPNNSTDNKFCAGEFDLGCIGISTSLHLAEVVADMAIDVTKAAKKDRTENNRGDDLA